MVWWVCILSCFSIQVGKKSAPSIACKDEFGNTALHHAAMHGHAEVAVYLLQSGIDPDIQNNKGNLLWKTG